MCSFLSFIFEFLHACTGSDPGGGGGGGAEAMGAEAPSKVMRCVTHILTKILASFK